MQRRNNLNIFVIPAQTGINNLKTWIPNQVGNDNDEIASLRLAMTNFMAEKICTICKKHSAMSVTLVKLRGKYNPTSKVRKYPNLQWAHLPSGKRVLACAKCIKRLSKV
ncbi:MAG: hypothetical protein A2528_02770 [Candidatus Staskawiczbacteria bacterium RIFOXYD2_FULL_37_9]|nr:MAG: hypothetical protein A2528_02770 [Candidatus Staskawiczbacteria bacterium RIFOXYD2_FULL_37_9]